MKDFNLHKYLRDNPLTANKDKKNINEAFEGFGGYRDVAPIHESPIQPKDFGNNQDPWGWNDHTKKMRDDEENRPNKWMMDIDRYPHPYKDWSVSWEYPGIIVWAHADIQDAVVVATPGWDGEGTPVEFQSAKGSIQMLKVLDQDVFPDFKSYVRAIQPYLDMVEDANLGDDNMSQDDYMGTPHDSSEDMNEDLGYATHSGDFGGDDSEEDEDGEAFVSTPEGNKAVAELKSFISRPYEDEELQDLLNMLKLTREQFLTVAQVAGMKLKSGWGGITIKDRNYKGTTPYIEYVPDTRKWWVG